MRLQQLTPSKLTGLPLAQAMTEFKLHQRTSRHTEKTLAYYDYALGKLTPWLEAKGLTTVEEIDPGTVRAFMLHLEDHLRPNSVHAVMRGVRAFLNFLEREELIDRSPMARVKMPKQDKALLPAFTREEIAKLEKATSGKEPTDIRNRALILLLLDSGLRLAECASLKVGDIDPQTGILRVMGKGRKERVSKLGAVALKAFNRYARLRGGKAGEPLWLGCRGAMTSSGLAETLEKLCK